MVLSHRVAMKTIETEILYTSVKYKIGKNKLGKDFKKTCDQIY